jgi:hypothetical protein
MMTPKIKISSEELAIVAEIAEVSAMMTEGLVKIKALSEQLAGLQDKKPTPEELADRIRLVMWYGMGQPEAKGQPPKT